MAKRKSTKKKDGKPKDRTKELSSPLVSAHASTAVQSKPKADGESNKPQNAPRPLSKRSQKRARKEALEHMEEQRLTALLFGTSDNMHRQEHEDELGDYGAEEIEGVLDHDDGETGEFTFEIDRVGQDMDGDGEDAGDQTGRGINDTLGLKSGREGGDDDDDDDSRDGDDGDGRDPSNAPAWIDQDDRNLSVNIIDSSSRLKKLRKSRHEAAAVALDGDEFERRLRQRYENTTQTTARTDWAKLEDVRTATTVQEKQLTDVEDDDAAVAAELLGSTSAPLLASSRDRLPPNILNIVRCPDANQSDPNDAVVQAVHFHPGSDPEKPLLLTAGLDKTLRFFQVGADSSQKIHGIHCKYLMMRRL